MLFNPPGVSHRRRSICRRTRARCDYPLSARRRRRDAQVEDLRARQADVDGPFWVSSELADWRSRRRSLQMKLEMAAAERGKPAQVAAAGRAEDEVRRAGDRQAAGPSRRTPPPPTAAHRRRQAADLHRQHRRQEPGRPARRRSSARSRHAETASRSCTTSARAACCGSIRRRRPRRTRLRSSRQPLPRRRPPSRAASGKAAVRLEKLRLEAAQK